MVRISFVFTNLGASLESLDNKHFWKDPSPKDPLFWYWLLFAAHFATLFAMFSTWLFQETFDLQFALPGVVCWKQGSEHKQHREACCHYKLLQVGARHSLSHSLNLCKALWNTSLGWSPTSGKRTSGTSRPSPGHEVIVTILCSSPLLSKLCNSRELWEYTWKSQIFFYQTSATNLKLGVVLPRFPCESLRARDERERGSCTRQRQRQKERPDPDRDNDYIILIPGIAVL